MYNRVEDKLRKDKKLFVYFYTNSVCKYSGRNYLSIWTDNKIDVSSKFVFFTDKKIELNTDPSTPLKLKDILKGDPVTVREMLDMAKRWKLLPNWNYDISTGKHQLTAEGILEFSRVED